MQLWNADQQRSAILRIAPMHASRRRQLKTRTRCSFAWEQLGVRVFRFLTAVISLRLHPFAFPEKTIVGTQVSATCTTVEAAQNVRFRWFKNGRLLTGSERDGRIRLRTFPDVSTLVIGPLEENDSGNYTCTGTAGLKSDSHTQNLHVLGESHSGEMT